METLALAIRHNRHGTRFRVSLEHSTCLPHNIVNMPLHMIDSWDSVSIDDPSVSFDMSPFTSRSCGCTSIELFFLYPFIVTIFVFPKKVSYSLQRPPHYFTGGPVSCDAFVEVYVSTEGASSFHSTRVYLMHLFQYPVYLRQVNN